MSNLKGTIEAIKWVIGSWVVITATLFLMSYSFKIWIWMGLGL